MFELEAPSIRVLFDCPLVPFTLKIKARDGLPGTEWRFSGGVKPGSRMNRPLIIPARRNRKIGKRLRGNLSPHFRAIRLEHGGRRRHVHRFGDCAHFQHDARRAKRY